MRNWAINFITSLFLLICLSCSPGTGEKNEQTKGEISELEMAMGKKVYEENCLVCHQEDGGGVPGLNPPLIGTEWVVGDKERLIKVVLNGLNEPITIEGETYANVMPALNFLSDQEIALVLTYIRNDFDNQAGPVNTSEVADVRSTLTSPTTSDK
ncbi:MAG: cytochrome c [Bacteroidota bacterium]